MALAPGIAAALQLFKPEGAPPLHLLPVQLVRDGMAAQAAASPIARRTVGSVEDRNIAGPGGDLPVRIYAPAGTDTPPLIVYFHGGGWVLCNLDTHDDICRHLCADVCAVVVSVDYRLAPEHKFPAGLDDAFRAVEWAAAHAHALGTDGRRLALAGDSAGATLAIVTALRCAAAGLALRAVLALYPATDLRLPSVHASVRENGHGGYGVAAADMEWFCGHYLRNPQDALDPRASPLLADDLGGLPPTLLATAEYDMLRDEGRALAQRIAAAGVAVQDRCFDGLPHGFASMTAAAPAALNALTELSQSLTELLKPCGVRAVDERRQRENVTAVGKDVLDPNPLSRAP